MFKYILLFLIVFSKLSFADTEKISLDKLKLLMSEGVPLIDIRTAKEWQETGVIKDSHLITFFNESGEVDIYKWLNELEFSEWLYNDTQVQILRDLKYLI